MNIPKAGDHVVWKWRGSVIEGVVEEVSPKRIEIISKGKRVVRNGTAENPAVAMSHKSGNPVVKLASELEIL